MSDLYIGQNYANQVDQYNSTFTGNPGNSGSGINWPYDPKGETPDPSQFQINWNAPDAADQAERVYERLVEWLKNNPGCYNGFMMLLQMTVEIGQHMGHLSPQDQQKLSHFLSNELKSTITEKDGSKNTVSILALIIQAAYEGAAISKSSKDEGQAAAEAFLNQLMQSCSNLQGFSIFKLIYDSASSDLQGLPEWINDHTDSKLGKFSWVTKAADGQEDPISFKDFTGEAAFSIGLALTSDGSNTGSVIDAYYQAEIKELVAKFKHNPWALLAALMNLINQRDEDDGMGVNGYGNNLDVLKNANGLIGKLLADLRNIAGKGKDGALSDTADFFKVLGQLRTLVEQDPALKGLVDQLQSDVNTINGQTVNGVPGDEGQNGYDWSVGPGFYHFPPGATITVFMDGKKTTITVPKDGLVYFAKDAHITYLIDHKSGGSNPKLTMGQLAAMGDTQDIAKAMGSWSDTVMSNFENGVTGIQTLLNGASPAIQQEIQTTTQTMQARENFEKQAFSSITTINQQIMRMVQQVMG